MKFAPGAWRYALPPFLAAPFALLYSAVAALAAVVLGGAVLGFFRDPDRTPPARGVVSPADGKVSVLREETTEDGETVVRLGVFMNVWNVHVARAPADGAVVDVEHTPGANKPAFSKDSDRNERVHVRVDSGDSDGSPVREVTLVAGAFARRIHPYVEPGDAVDRAERIGHIAFGSRIDVVFPPTVQATDLLVGPGDRVRAGETVILDDVSGGEPAWT